MMFDCAKADDVFGYIHTHPTTGQIASIGTLCKIIDRQLLEDGRQFIALKGIGRFRVNKILKTLPYVLAEVDVNVVDDLVADEEAVQQLELSVYNYLKYYMRLLKTYENNKDMYISQAAKTYRPTKKGSMLLLNDSLRRTDFSFSLANMIQMTQAKESQLLLQTKDIAKRLKVERVILRQATELISEQLLKINVLSLEKKEAIFMKSFYDEDDSDILPPDTIEPEVVKEKDEWDLSNME